MFQSGSAEIHKALSEKYNVNRKVVEMICNHPFIFTKNVISSMTDEHAIMMAGLFKIRLKRRFRGGNKNNMELRGKRKYKKQDSIKE